MPKHKILNQEPLSLSMVKEELEKTKERDKTLNFRAQKTLDYIQGIGVLELSKAKKLFNELMELKNARLKDVHCQKLVDILPTTPEDVKLVLQGYNLNLSKEALSSIAEVLKKYAQ